MKVHPLLLLFFLLFTSSFFITSCVVEKRRYRSGYHIKKTAFKPKSRSNKNEGYTSRKKLITNTKEKISLDTSIYNIELPLPKHEAKLNTIQPASHPLDIERNNLLASTKTTTQIKASNLSEHLTRLVLPKPIVSNMELAIKTVESDVLSNQKQTTAIAATKKEITAKQWALIIGLSLVLMTILAGVSVPVINQVLSPTSPLTTFAQLGANKNQFFLAIMGWLGIFILDLLVAWGVIKKYEEKDRSKAIISGSLRFLYTLILGIAISQLFRSYTTTSALIAHNSLLNFNQIWGAGLIIFGLHLMVLAFVFKGDSNKKWLDISLSVLLFLGGLGYVLQYVTYFLFPQQLVISATIESIFIVFMILGEIGFGIYMLVKGLKKAS